MGAAALLLPGQGAQAVGMGKAFYDRYEASRAVYKRANAHLGFDVTALCFEGPQEALTRTDTCQPALFVTSIAAVEAFREYAPSVQPVGAAGLSLGELTALAAAGALKFTDALYLVQARGEAMADCAAHHAGSMLAVMGLSPGAVQEIAQGSGAWAANYNAQDQVVFSGTAEAIERAEKSAKARGAKRAVKLDVAGAFHSPLMRPAAEAFAQALSKIGIRPPAFPVVSNVTGEATQDPEAIRELLVRQITSPVLWEPSMRFLLRAGATHFIEFPPARVLTGLLRRIDPAAKGVAVDEPEDFERIDLGSLSALRPR